MPPTPIPTPSHPCIVVTKSQSRQVLKEMKLNHIIVQTGRVGLST